MNRILLFKGDEWGHELFYSKESKKVLIRYDNTPLQDYLFEENREYKIISWDNYIEYKEKYNISQYCKPWIETSEDYFWEKLECLPPYKWTNNGIEERFLMSEYYTGNITEHNIRINNKYYAANRPDYMSLSDCIKEINNQFNHV